MPLEQQIYLDPASIYFTEKSEQVWGYWKQLIIVIVLKLFSLDRHLQSCFNIATFLHAFILNKT